MHTCIHRYIHSYMRGHPHWYMHTCIHAYLHPCIHASMHTCIHAYMYTHTHTHTHTHTQQSSALCNLLHSAAMRLGHHQYVNPVSGEAVFTAKYLKNRTCCGKSCRHCPHKNKNYSDLKPTSSGDSDKYIALDETRLASHGSIDNVRASFLYGNGSLHATNLRRHSQNVPMEAPPASNSAAAKKADPPELPTAGAKNSPPKIKHPYSKSGGKFSFSMDGGMFR
jgi:hypothetical protein